MKLNIPAAFFAIGASLLLCSCGSRPPVVKSSRDIQRLPSNEDSVRARGLSDNEIAALARLRKLRVLDFSGGHAVAHAPLTDEGLARLVEIDLPQLEILTFGYSTNLTDNGLVHIGRMHTVKWLSFMACPNVTDRGLPHLLAMKNLTGLDLRGCSGISDRGLEILATKTNWQTILLGGCTNVTPAGVSRLQAALPKARVEKNEQEWSHLQRPRPN